MSIRTMASAEEIAAAEPLYQALRENRSNKRLHKGLVVSKRWWGKLAAIPLRWRMRSVTLGCYLLLAASLLTLGAPISAVLTSALIVLLATAVLEWQIIRPIENVACQALSVAIGERNSVDHLKRGDELGLMLRSVGQLGLMCRWLINDVSSQVNSVSGGSDVLARGNEELNQCTQETVVNVQ